MINLPFELIPLARWKVYRALLPKGSAIEHRIIIMSNVDDLEFFYVTRSIEKAKVRMKKKTKQRSLNYPQRIGQNV